MARVSMHECACFCIKWGLASAVQWLEGARFYRRHAWISCALGPVRGARRCWADARWVDVGLHKINLFRAVSRQEKTP